MVSAAKGSSALGDLTNRISLLYTGLIPSLLGDLGNFSRVPVPSSVSGAPFVDCLTFPGVQSATKASLACGPGFRRCTCQTGFITGAGMTGGGIGCRRDSL